MKPKPLGQVAYEAYFSPLFDYRLLSPDKRLRWAKVARAVLKAGRKRK